MAAVLFAINVGILYWLEKRDKAVPIPLSFFPFIQHSPFDSSIKENSYNNRQPEKPPSRNNAPSYFAVEVVKCTEGKDVTRTINCSRSCP
ncbi:hypothetical protein CEXT_116641 [Caerostris extrusa]|uniref:Uncharacterized protein n=1 Tax=Caerostris extrusa TaxID=172846 RepID=A0AAV4NUW0_CAEEX|nr:hypothetical protein CEXT_116641 [Caerostris extrusa]